jgi:hypothetical protein
MKRYLYFILAFVLTFCISVVVFWTPFFVLAFLDARGVIDTFKLPKEIQEKVLDIQCGKDDGYCRREICTQ